MRISCKEDIDTGVKALARACPVMKEIHSRCAEIPLRLSTADFEGLASIIVSQQVSKASADAIFGRLRARVSPLTANGFVSAGEEVWIEAGLSRPKQRTLVAISEALDQGTLDLEKLSGFSPEDALAQLVAIKGIGPWTGEVYLMFCAGHSDIFPAGDLALQEAIRMAFNLKERPDEKKSRKIAERWSPWRSVAARVLWAYYAAVKRDAAPV